MNKQAQSFLNHSELIRGMITDLDTLHHVNNAFVFALVKRLDNSIDGRLSVDDLKHAYLIAYIIGSEKEHKLEQLISEVMR